MCDMAETRVREEAESEVYVGFNELDALLEALADGVASGAAGEADAVIDSLSEAVSGLPDDSARVDTNALMRSALHHIIDLQCKLAGAQGVVESSRASWLAERCRADQAESRASELNLLLESRERTEKQRLAEATGELQDELAEAQIDADVLRRRVRELESELVTWTG